MPLHDTRCWWGHRGNIRSKSLYFDWSKYIKMKYTTWLTIAAIFQLLSALAHSIGFFVEPVAANDSEKMLLDLMNTYKMDMGAGISRSMNDLFTALSACFTLLYLFAALLNGYLMRSRVNAEVMRGVIILQVSIFGISFALMAYFTFLPPIILTGLVFIFLLMSLISLPGKSKMA